MAPDPTALLERAQNQEAIERRLTELLDGPSAAKQAVAVVAAIVTAASGAVLTGSMATAPPSPDPPLLGVVAGQIMLATGTLLVGITLAQLDARPHRNGTPRRKPLGARVPRRAESPRCSNDAIIRSFVKARKCLNSRRPAQPRGEEEGPACDSDMYRFDLTAPRW